jgi:hypothetical protein
MANVCTPTTTTEGGGTCTFNPVQAISRVIQVTSTQTREISVYPYVFTATANAGWAFDHFNVTYKWDSLDGSTVGPYTTANITGNPFALRDTIGDNANPLNWWYGGWLGEWAEKTGTATTFERWCSLYAVKAVFVRVPTHLLVNSFNKSSPVQLVYDPTTNLLVADF